MKKITAKDNIAEVLLKYPETYEVFFKYGFHCVGCAMASYETIEEGALITHGSDKKYLKKLIAELNKAIKTNKEK